MERNKRDNFGTLPPDPFGAEATGLTGAERLPVPDKCKNCPVMKHKQAEVEALYEKLLEDLGVDQQTRRDTAYKQLKSQFNEYAQEHDVPESPEETEKMLRHLATELVAKQADAELGALNDLDRQIEVMRNIVEGLTEACRGPLKMRAGRGDVVVTTVSCMSPPIVSAAHGGDPVVTSVAYSKYKK